MRARQRVLRVGLESATLGRMLGVIERILGLEDIR